jgi:LPS sulfotransferase NodH
MLEEIETGYEEKFDFPYREALPERTYILASVPRTGSTYVSHLLWQSGCLGAPLEYFNFLPTGHYGSVSGSPEKQIELWRSILHRRTSPNGVFGVKAFPSMVQHLAQRNAALFQEVTATLLAGANPRIVQLKRRDRAAHAISYARARLSGIWRAEQEKAQPSSVEYSEAAVEEALQVLGREESGWESLFAYRRIEPLILWYEDVVEQPETAVRQVSDHVGVALDSSMQVTVPEIRRQSQVDAVKWTERHAHGSGD